MDSDTTNTATPTNAPPLEEAWPTREVPQPLSSEDEKHYTQVASPLIDALAGIQETRYALAHLWLESEGLEGVNIAQTEDQEPDEDVIESIGEVAAGEMVDPEHQERIEEFLEENEDRAEAIKSRPKWEEYIPKDLSDAGSVEKLDKFVATFPKYMQLNIREHLLELGSHLRVRDEQMANPDVMNAHRFLSSERYRVLHVAGQYDHFKHMSEMLTARAVEMRLNAHLRKRRLDAVEERIIKRYQDEAAQYDARAAAAVTDPDVVKEIERRAAIRRAEQLKEGFLETPYLRDIIDLASTRIAAGLPAGFFGEIGGAKSAMAEFIARERFDSEPIVLDCGPDVTMAKLFGSTKLKSVNGAPETTEEAGEITRAAEEGRIVILNEFDTLPGRIRTALNGALQWRANGRPIRPFGLDRDIIVKPGFAIIVTANVRSARYDREKLDASTKDRLQNGGAGIFEIHYPDAALEPDTGTAQENLMLALAQLTDEFGDVHLPAGLTEPGQTGSPVDRLIAFVNTAHLIQRLFSDPAAIAGRESFVPDSQYIARSRQHGKPILEEAVISPRGMLGILRNLQISESDTTLSRELAGWVASQTSDMDRKIVAVILASRGLLAGMTEQDLKIPEGTLKRFTSSVNGAQANG